MHEIDYQTLNNVIESWEKIRRLDDYELKAGLVLFRKLFKTCPQAKVLFGFPATSDVDSPEILNSKRFKMHARYMIEMLDTALNMLGPDIELLGEILLELGEKHVSFGVRADMFPLMGEALIHTLKECLGGAFDDEIEECWHQVYHEISQDMLSGMKK